MKIAVIGGGSTYTPELVSGMSRDQERIDVRELVLHDIDEERREVVGGLAERMLERQGYGGTLTVTDDLDRALDGADFVLIQIRVGGQDARLSDETVPLACGCIGQETTGAGGLGKALRTVPVVLGIAERVRQICRRRRLDRRLHESRRHRHARAARRRAIAPSACATSRSASSAGSRACSTSSRSASLIDQVGLNHLTWVRAVRVDGEDVLPSCSPRTATRSPTTSARRARCSRSSARSPRTTCTTSTPTTRCSPSSSTACRARHQVAEIERELLRAVPRPEPRREAGAPRAARRRVLQRGGDRPRRLARQRRRRRARRRRAQRRHARRSRGRRRGRGARARRARRRGGAAQAPLAPELLGLDAARRGLRAARRARGG